MAEARTYVPRTGSNGVEALVVSRSRIDAARVRIDARRTDRSLVVTLVLSNEEERKLFGLLHADTTLAAATPVSNP